MIYTADDLKYIYIRVGAKNVHLESVSDKDFVDWAQERFQVKISSDKELKYMPWSSQDRADFLTEMSARSGGGHVVLMLIH
jgi:hypothetical protein